jgi:hypothetical protein
MVSGNNGNLKFANNLNFTGLFLGRIDVPVEGILNTDKPINELK